MKYLSRCGYQFWHSERKTALMAFLGGVVSVDFPGSTRGTRGVVKGRWQVRKWGALSSTCGWAKMEFDAVEDFEGAKKKFKWARCTNRGTVGRCQAGPGLVARLSRRRRLADDRDRVGEILAVCPLGYSPCSRAPKIGTWLLRCAPRCVRPAVGVVFQVMSVERRASSVMLHPALQLHTDVVASKANGAAGKGCQSCTHSFRPNENQQKIFLLPVERGDCPWRFLCERPESWWC